MPKTKPGAGRARLDPEPDRGLVRVLVGVEPQHRLPGRRAAARRAARSRRRTPPRCRAPRPASSRAPPAARGRTATPSGGPSSSVRAAISGSWSASWAERRPQRRALGRVDASTDASSVGGAKWCSSARQRVAEAVAHADGGEPVQPADPAGPDLVGADPLALRRRPGARRPCRCARPAGRAADGSAPSRRTSGRRRPSRPPRPRSTLNTRPDGSPVGRRHGAGRNVAIPAISSGTPAPVAAEPANTGCSTASRVWAAASASSWPGVRSRPSTYAASRASSCSARATGLALAEGAVVGSVRREGRGPRPEPRGGAHRQDVRGQPAPDRLQDAVDVGAGAVDLVDEQQGRHPEPLQRPHQDPGLRLDPLDRGQHEHGAVEHAEDALDLGDEVGVARGVDDVDRHVVERERHDGGLDRDAAPALEREAVGPGGAGVDRPRLVDDSREVQEPLGESGLTGVDVGEDAQVE